MQIVIVGEMPSSRKAISLLVQARLGIKVAGETGNISELMYLVDAVSPDIILLDGDLPNVNINELIASFRGIDSSPSVIVLDHRPEIESGAKAAGADIFVSKGSHSKQLLIAIEKIRNERGHHKNI